MEFEVNWKSSRPVGKVLRAVGEFSPGRVLQCRPLFLSGSTAEGVCQVQWEGLQSKGADDKGWDLNTGKACCDTGSALECLSGAGRWFGKIPWPHLGLS